MTIERLHIFNNSIIEQAKHIQIRLGNGLGGDNLLVICDLFTDIRDDAARMIRELNENEDLIEARVVSIEKEMSDAELAKYQPKIILDAIDRGLGKKPTV